MPSLDDFADQARVQARKAAQDQADREAEYCQECAQAMTIARRVSADFLQRLRTSKARPQTFRGDDTETYNQEVSRGFFKSPEVRTASRHVERQVAGYLAGYIVVSTSGQLYHLRTESDKGSSKSYLRELQPSDLVATLLPYGSPRGTLEERLSAFESNLLSTFGQALAQYVP